MSRLSYASVEPGREESTPLVSQCEPGREEGIHSEGGGKRWVVDEKALDSPPYNHVVRLKVRKPCCGYDQGTAFLVSSESETHCYYVTAAHVLYCIAPEHEHAGLSHLANEVQIWPGRESAPQIESVLRHEDRTFSPDEAWFNVNPRYIESVGDRDERLNHDFAVIALLREDIKGKYYKGNGFRVLPQADLRSSFTDCYVSGFPLNVTNRGRKVHQNKEMFEHGGLEISRVPNVSGLWSHRIDTTGGQSGSPLFEKKSRVVYGIHVYHRHRSNEAVVLDQESIRLMMNGFPSPIAEEEAYPENEPDGQGKTC